MIYNGMYHTLSGHKCWYLNNRYHREDGPAIESRSGEKQWWINGQRHREDGPAIELSDGRKIWYYKYKYIN